MILHDECWWRSGRSQTLCGHNMHPLALKPSHTMKACVLSNHVKFWCIHAQVEGILTLAPFIAQRVMSIDNGIGDGIVGRRSMTFQESFDKYFVDGNGEWWQGDCMMNVDENVDDLKYYAGTTCIPEPWNPPIAWRHVSYLIMSNFDTYKQKLKEFQRWPLLGTWLSYYITIYYRFTRSVNFDSLSPQSSITLQNLINYGLILMQLKGDLKILSYQAPCLHLGLWFATELE